MHSTILKLLIVAAMLAVTCDCHGQRLYFKIGGSRGWGIGTTKLAKTQWLGVSVGVGYRVMNDVHIGIDWQYDLVGLTLRNRTDLSKSLSHEKISNLEPSSFYGGTAFAITYALPPRSGSASWYCSGGFATQKGVKQPMGTYWNQTVHNHDSTMSVTVKGDRILSYVAPFIEFGLYSTKDGKHRPTVGGIGFHFGLRYTYTPMIYHGTYHQENSDGSVKDGNMIMSGGYVSGVFTFPIGKKSRGTHKKEKPKLNQTFRPMPGS